MAFFEQISINLEWSGIGSRRNRAQIFRRILFPLMIPGILTAGVLILVNTISNFELAFLLGAADRRRSWSRCLQHVCRRRAAGLLDRCMAVIYMVMVMALLLVALRFVRPTQMVFKLDR